MALADHIRTYTLVDLKVAPVTGDTPGTLVDIPGIQSCEVTISNEAVELRGDNRLMSVVDQGNGASFSLAAGGLDLEALAVILGGATADEGTTPDIVRTWTLKADDARPYFTIVGVQPDDGSNGHDLHVIVWKAKATGDFTLGMADQEFTVPSIEGSAVGRSDNGDLISLVQHETATAAEIPS